MGGWRGVKRAPGRGCSFGTCFAWLGPKVGASGCCVAWALVTLIVFPKGPQSPGQPPSSPLRARSLRRSGSAKLYARVLHLPVLCSESCFRSNKICISPLQLPAPLTSSAPAAERDFPLCMVLPSALFVPELTALHPPASPSAWRHACCPAVHHSSVGASNPSVADLPPPEWLKELENSRKARSVPRARSGHQTSPGTRVFRRKQPV